MADFKKSFYPLTLVGILLGVCLLSEVGISITSPAATFYVYENDELINITTLGQNTTPQFGTGHDLQLFSGYHTFATDTNLTGGYVRLALVPEDTLVTVQDEQEGVFGYDRTDIDDYAEDSITFFDSGASPEVFPIEAGSIITIKGFDYLVDYYDEALKQVELGPAIRKTFMVYSSQEEAISNRITITGPLSLGVSSVTLPPSVPTVSLDGWNSSNTLIVVGTINPASTAYPVDLASAEIIAGMFIPPLTIIEDIDLTASMKSNFNLIIVGGPVANNITADLVASGVSIVDWYSSEGEIETISNAFSPGKYAIIAAGQNREATRLASQALADSL